MDEAVKAWLISQVGTATDLTDLTARYTRLGTARATALEILNERLADLRAQVAVVGVSGVVNVSFAENIKAYERQIALLESGTPAAPDDPTDNSDDDTPAIGLLQLVPRRRR
jgi:hypothetical protein